MKAKHIDAEDMKFESQNFYKDAYEKMRDLFVKEPRCSLLCHMGESDRPCRDCRAREIIRRVESYES